MKEIIKTYLYRCYECKKFVKIYNGKNEEICSNCGYIHMKKMGIHTAKIYGYKGDINGNKL